MKPTRSGAWLLYVLLPLAGVAVVLGFGASAMSGGRAGLAKLQFPLAWQVRVEDFRQTVRVVGRLQAEKTTRITSPLSGLPITDIVPEGSEVKKGDVIVQLDPSTLEEQILDVKNNIVSTEAELAVARATFEKTKLDINSTIKELEAKLAVAEARLRVEESKPLPEHRRAAEAKLDEAEARSNYAEHWLEATEALFEEGVLSREDVRLAELSHYTATVARQQAQNALDETLKGAKPEDLESARAELTQARIALQEARDTREQRIKRAEAAVKAAENSVEKLRKELSQVEEDLAQTQVEAEHDGTVFSHGGRRATVGDTAWRGRVLADLADTSSLLLEAKVRECDSQLVKVGQPAQVYLLSVRSAPVGGTVAKVGDALVEDETTPNMRYLEVEIELDVVPAGVRPRMSGYAEVEVKRIPGALVIPQACIAENCAVVITEAGPQTRPVEVLASNGTVAAIGSGLTEGQWVSLRGEE